MNATRRTRADGQISGLAGEFFVAGELLKRDLQTSVTFGNAKSIDLLTFNARTLRSFTVQVKTVRNSTYFPIRLAAIAKHLVYVFVVLNRPGRAVRYFIVRGSDILRNPDAFRGLQDEKFPAIHRASLEPYEDRWDVFEQPGPDAI